jgi:hypothetical protein
MKIAVALILLAIILAAGIGECIFIERSFDELDGRLDVIKNFLILNQAERALDEVSKLADWWEDKKNKMELFTFSPDIRLLSVSIGETKGSLEIGDKNNAMSKIESIYNISHNLREILNFNLRDII